MTSRFNQCFSVANFSFTFICSGLSHELVVLVILRYWLDSEVGPMDAAFDMHQFKLNEYDRCEDVSLIETTTTYKMYTPSPNSQVDFSIKQLTTDWSNFPCCIYQICRCLVLSLHSFIFASLLECAFVNYIARSKDSVTIHGEGGMSIFKEGLKELSRSAFTTPSMRWWICIWCVWWILLL